MKPHPRFPTWPSNLSRIRANRKKLADKIELAHLDPTKKVSMPSNLKV
jgi:hypothetical protein